MPLTRFASFDLNLMRDGATDGERVALWRDAFNLAGRVQIDDGTGFSGELVSSAVGDLRTMRAISSTFRVERNRAMAARVRHDHVFVNLVKRGRITGKVSRRDVAVEQGGVFLSRFTSPLDIRIEDAEWIGLIIPRLLFEKSMRWSPSFDARVYEPGTAQAIMLSGLLQSLVSLPDPLPARLSTSLARSSLAFLTGCLGGQASTRTAPIPETSDGDLALAIRRVIAERLADPDLGPDLICREFAISRSRLYRIMGDGADIATIIRRMRLRYAQRDIAANRFPDLTIAGIGRRWGLMDDRTFRRAFQQEFGYAPSALRKRARSNGAPVKELGAISADLDRWFRGL